MSEMLWIRSHVERLLQDEWKVCRVEPDQDGDYTFRAGTAACWVSLIDGEHPMVRVVAHAACGLRKSAKLFGELNDIQLRATSATLMLFDGCVIIGQTVSAIGLTGPVLAQAMSAVADTAEEFGPLLAGMFGGSPPFDAELSESEDAD